MWPARSYDRSVFSAALVLILIVYAVRRLAFGYGEPRGEYRRLRRHEAAFLDGAAEAMFPEGGAIPLSGLEADLPRYVDRYFDALPDGKRFQIRLLLLFFEQATVFFPAPGRLGFRRFSALRVEQRLAVLEGWSDSSWFLRRLIFTALRAVLTMGYLGDPVALRHLRLAPYDIQSPVAEADLIYPAIGAHPDTIVLTRDDLSTSDGTPIDLTGPLHPDFAERPL